MRSWENASGGSTIASWPAFACASTFETSDDPSLPSSGLVQNPNYNCASVALRSLAVHLYHVVAQEDQACSQDVRHDEHRDQREEERGAGGEASLFHGRDEDVVNDALGDGRRDQGGRNHEHGKCNGKHGPAVVRPRGTEQPSKRCHYVTKLSSGAGGFK